MKKVVLTFGLLMGAVPASVMVVGLLINAHWEGALMLGWSILILASVFIFLGIRSYRENYNNGVISFGKAFKVGILITLIATLLYAVLWDIMYFSFMHDVMDSYFAAETEKLMKSGASQEKIEQSIEMGKLYKSNPVVVLAFTMLEPLPVTVPVTLISSLILKRKTKKEAAA